MDDAVDSFLTELSRTEHEEPVLLEMEVRAAAHDVPCPAEPPARPDPQASEGPCSPSTSST